MGAEAELQATTEGVLKVADPATGTWVAVPVVLGWPEPEGSEVVCDLFFIDGTEITESGQSRVQRRAVRVQPPHDEVIVALRSDRPGQQGAAPVTLLDLSAAGLAVEMPVGQEPTTPFTSGTFEVWVPELGAPMVLVATVRNRSRRSKELVRYGVEFDPSRTQGYAEASAMLAGWVQRKRVELMRKAQPT
jgi:hypothetical protein